MSRATYPSLQGRRVLITGGASGIGEGIARAFVEQGSQVEILDILEVEGQALEQELSTAAGTLRFRQCDLTDLSALNAAMSAVGDVDVLVNNAANDERHTLQQVTGEYFDQAMAVNLRHMLFCTKSAASGMQARGGGVVINLGSISWHLGLPNLVVYETAKAGIEGMTRALARELGPHGIRVCAVVPGNVLTPRQQQHYTSEDEARLVAQQCIGQRILPNDVAALVLFLSSDDARMCTGHEYWIDAGWR